MALDFGDRQELKRAASVARRTRLRNRAVPRYREILDAQLRAEVAAIQSVLDDEGVDIDGWLAAFYAEHGQALAAALEPLTLRYGTATSKTALEEVDSDASVPVAEFAGVYAGNAAVRWVNSSVAQLRDIVATEAEDVADVIAERLVKWEETRPGWTSEREATQAGSAFVKLAFVAAGVTKLVWRANAGACDFCMEMNGKVVGIEQSFARAGDEVAPGGDTAPMSIPQTIGHPPLHGLNGRGGVCQCQIAAA
jgi:hypothetical protein